MKNHWQFVVASSDLESRRRVAEILGKHGLDPICSSSVAQCREILAQDMSGMIFCDRSLVDGGYRDLVAAADCGPTRGKVRIVLMSSAIDSEEYHAAKSSGLFEVIASPCKPTEVEWMVIQAKRDDRKMAKQPMTSNETSREWGAA
jgi:DNA-binding NtrC family response regulator